MLVLSFLRTGNAIGQGGLMIGQNNEWQDNIVESMNKAFDNRSFYGLEYVLDELEGKKTIQKAPYPVDWFGFWDRFD